jgi:aminoglycoside phosphotransferase family enzyme/predicted kinase
MTSHAHAALAAHETLVRALAEPARYPHPVEHVRVIETHISSVLLTGAYAYKIKKPVNLGFLDFSTLARRRFFCEEELRLNRRLAPQLYLDVVAIRGSHEQPHLGGSGPLVEYAIKMAEFPQQALLDGMLARGELLPGHIDALARVVAEFHGSVARAGPGQEDFGSPDRVWEPVRQNFAQIHPRLDSEEDHRRLREIEHWSRAAHARLTPAFERRRSEGFVRECHGDLHLGNIALVGAQVTVFDCIEFNPNLHWIDVASEIAFLFMDLGERGRKDYAWRFLNSYLERTGDYDALKVLTYYRVYRAMVRAKVARIRASQEHLDEHERGAALASYRAYLDHAAACIRDAHPALIFTHGLSGAGKTTATQALLEGLGAVRIRSDVERKRLQGLGAAARSGSGLGSGLYAEQMTRATYAELARVAGETLTEGHLAVVDAACLERWQRDLLRQAAERAGAPHLLVECAAAAPELRRRVIERQQTGADASEATLDVLEYQLKNVEPLAADEVHNALVIETGRLTAAEIVASVRRALEALA